MFELAKHIMAIHLLNQVKHVLNLTSSELNLSEFAEMRNKSQFKDPSISYDLWYDPPCKPMAFNRTVHDSKDSLLMIFKCKLRSSPASVLIDTGACHSFVDLGWLSS